MLWFRSCPCFHFHSHSHAFCSLCFAALLAPSFSPSPHFCSTLPLSSTLLCTDHPHFHTFLSLLSCSTPFAHTPMLICCCDFKRIESYLAQMVKFSWWIMHLYGCLLVSKVFILNYYIESGTSVPEVKYVVGKYYGICECFTSFFLSPMRQRSLMMIGGWHTGLFL